MNVKKSFPLTENLYQTILPCPVPPFLGTSSGAAPGRKPRLAVGLLPPHQVSMLKEGNALSHGLGPAALREQWMQGSSVHTWKVECAGYERILPV